MAKFFKLPIVILILLMALSIFLCAAEDPEGWSLSKSTDKMKLYRRPLQGFDIDEFKGICEDKVRIEVLGAVLENIPNYVNWIELLVESKIIKKNDEDHMIIYHRYDAMWPLDDRDCIAKVEVKRDYKTGKFTINLDSINEPLVSLKKNTVRIPVYSAKIIIEYIDREHTKETYIGKVDLGGVIPAWLSNLLNQEIPFQMLGGLSKESQKKENIEAAKDSILKTKIEESIARGFLKP